MSPGIAGHPAKRESKKETRNPLLKQGIHGGGQGRRRSVDLWFFRPALYRLSYLTSRPEPVGLRVGGNDGI